MLRSEYDFDILNYRHRIVIFDSNEPTTAWTFHFQKHDGIGGGSALPASEFRKEDLNHQLFQALANVLQKMDLFPKDAGAAELKATNRHLEDMRTLVFNKISDESY